jgi:HAMP domain-containing protein
VIEEIESQDLDFNVQKDVLATVARGIQRLIEEAQQNLEEGRQNVANYNSSNTTTIDNGEYPETPVPATTARGQQATPRVSDVYSPA